MLKDQVLRQMKWLERRWSMTLLQLLFYRLLLFDWRPSNFTGLSMKVNWQKEHPLHHHLQIHCLTLLLHLLLQTWICLSVGITYTWSLLTLLGKRDRFRGNKHPTLFPISCVGHTISSTSLPTIQLGKEIPVKLSLSKLKEDVSKERHPLISSHLYFVMKKNKELAFSFCPSVSVSRLRHLLFLCVFSSPPSFGSLCPSVASVERRREREISFM